MAVVIGEGMDSGDKATNKAMAIAYKYACFQTFCIPTEEMKDPDSECHEVAPKQNPKQEPKQESKQEPSGGNVKMTDKITGVQFKALKSRMQKDGITEDFMVQLYKVEKLEEIDQRQYSHINEYWERIQELAKK